MRLIIGLILVLQHWVASADCVPPTIVEFRVVMASCQILTIEPDTSRDKETWENNTLKTLLVTGRVIESRDVTPNSSSFFSSSQAFSFAAGTKVSFFLEGNTNSVCDKVKRSNAPIFVTADRCCDTIPHAGNCLLPDGIPLAKIK